MKSLPHLPRVHHQQGKVICHFSVLCLESSLLLTVGWYKMCLTVLQLPLTELQILLFLVDPRHPDVFCLIAECSIIGKKMLLYKKQFGSEPLIPFLFSKPSLFILYRSAYLACSFFLPHATCVHNFHDCKTLRISQQAPRKWLQCPGHTPTLCKWWAPCPLPDSVQPAPPATSSHTCCPPHNFIHFLHSAPLRLLQPLQSAEPGAGTFIMFGVPFV